MITETVYTLGDLRKALSHLADDCPIHNEEGRGLKLHYDKNPVVIFEFGDWPDDDESAA
jgi:hypothetical protein